VKKTETSGKDEIIFLGTGGARYVIATQLRATGGVLLRIQGNNVLVDPGPESLCRLLTYVPEIDPEQLNAIVLSHKHIDHSADINVYLDIMTKGGFRKRGILLAPADAFGTDGVIFSYLIPHVREIITITQGLECSIGKLKFKFPLRHEHRVETYGFRLACDACSISYIADTKFFSGIIPAYGADIIILNLLSLSPSDIDHLSIPDCERIIRGIQPKVAFITHFGMTILKTGPLTVARQLEEKTGVPVYAAEDGKRYSISSLLSQVKI
jgi:ribonuclease BN (tRNA processing enzyme)